jgi:hypothetical protein
VRTSILLKDGTWDHERKGDKQTLGGKAIDRWKLRRDFLEKRKWQETYPYTYVLKSGEVQKRMATVGVEEREWRWRWFTWLPTTIAKRGLWMVFPANSPEPVVRVGWYDAPRKPLLGNVQRTISVDFSDEVGERSGSWKGGCTGCAYEMKPDETPWQTLMRMERERKF